MPLRKTGIQNGRDAIRFDGANDFLQYSVSVFGYTTAVSVFAATKNLTNAVNDYGAVIAEQSSGQTSIGCMPVTFPNAGMEISTDVFGPGGKRYGSTVAEAAPHVCDWSWSNWSTHKTNGNTVLAVDGIETAGTSYGSNPTGFVSTIKRIGNFDGSNNSSSCLNGDILEILVYSGQLTSSERIQVRRYLGAKWSISVA
jgi:hypothetical protein